MSKLDLERLEYELALGVLAFIIVTFFGASLEFPLFIITGCLGGVILLILGKKLKEYWSIKKKLEKH